MKRRTFLKAVTAGTLASAADGSKGLACPSISQTRREVAWSRKVPVRWETDVAVIGGGIAGVSAACAAADSGAKVVLVERFAICGGDLTSGGVASFCGRMDGNGRTFDEIVADLKRWDSIGQPRAEIFDHEILAVVLQELLLRHHVKLLLHTRFADVCAEDGRISACILAGFSGPEALAARQFIDCTGGGDVARAAGCRVMVSEEPLPMSMMYFVREGQNPGPQMPKDWPTTGKKLPRRSVWPNGPGEKANKQWLFKYSSIDTETMTAAEIAVRRTVMERHAADLASGKKWRYDHCSPVVGIREGCRIVGDYVLKIDDLLKARSFDDGVAVGTYQLDNHIPGAPMAYKQVPPYQIPLRSLIARDAKNLLMAGRGFYCDKLALSSARVSTSGSMMGQAAGIAAAMAAARDCDIRNLDPGEIRKAIELRGGKLDV
jgi:hypothetical protein